MLDYQTPQEVDGPRGIGGWLILPAIGIVISILRQAALALGLWMAADRVRVMAKQGSGAESLRVLALLCGAYTVYLLFTAGLFFAKKRAAPAGSDRHVSWRNRPVGGGFDAAAAKSQHLCAGGRRVDHNAPTGGDCAGVDPVLPLLTTGEAHVRQLIDPLCCSHPYVRAADS